MFISKIRALFDRFGKQLIRAVLARFGAVETEAEVPAETRRIDVWFTPERTRDPAPDHLGLLGRIAAGPCTFELFHRTPSGDDLADCLIKHGQLRHYLSLRNPPPPTPILWVISSGHPESGIRRLWFRPMRDWPSGIYEGPPLLWTRLLVVSELPVERSTLLLRLLGAGRVLRQAIAELKALQAEEPERMLVLPILVRLRLEVPIDPSKRTPEEQEFLMETQDIVERWRQEAVQQGRQEGIQQGFMQGERASLLRLLRHRFGDQVDTAIEQRIAAASGEQVEAWLVRVLAAATLAELLAS